MTEAHFSEEDAGLPNTLRENLLDLPESPAHAEQQYILKTTELHILWHLWA